MIGSGRCHGPGCTQAVKVEFWCGETCRVNWDRQALGLSLLPPDTDVAWGSPGFFTQAVADAMPEVQRRIATAMDQTLADVRQTRIVHEPPGSLYEDIVRLYERMTDAPPVEPVKLTAQQLATLREHTAEPSRWQVGPSLGPLGGVPIEIVETEEESTPYLERRKRFQRATREAGRHMPWLPAGMSLAFPQVEPGEPLPANPQVGDNNRRSEVGERGWLADLLHRLFGRSS